MTAMKNKSFTSTPITTLMQAEVALRSSGIVDDYDMVEGKSLLEICGFDFSSSNQAKVIKRQIERHDLVDGKDFTPSLEQSTGGRPKTVYYFTLNAANHILLAAMTKEGKQVQTERRRSTLSNLSERNTAMQSSPVQQETMSSREIAELTEKRHPDVKRDIQAQLGQLGDVSRFAHTYLDASNRVQTEYNLPRRECEILITGYDVKRRAAVIDRWFQLETQQVQPLASTGNPLLDALVQTQLQVDTQAVLIQQHEEKLEELTKPVEGVSPYVVDHQLRREGIRLSKEVIKKVSKYYEDESGYFEIPKPKADGGSYPEPRMNLEDALEVIRIWFNECIHYETRTNNRDFYHVESGIGGQYVR